MRTSLFLLALVVGCGDSKSPDRRNDGEPSPPTSSVPDPTDDDDDTTPPPERTYEVLDPVQRVVRASMELRGLRPPVGDLDAVLADPEAADGLIQGYLNDPMFSARVGELFAEVYWTRHEHEWVGTDFYLDTYSVEELARSIGVEPLKVISYIADNDLPITELVTGDWTMANAVLADIWPVDYPEGGNGWQKVHYTDARPRAGLLVSNGMWWKFGSMENNLNRKRANQISRIFLCHDYLDTEVVFEDTPMDAEAALADAVRDDPNCAVCHDSLDPLASHLFGFFYFGARKQDPFDIMHYHPEREREWVEYDMPPPGFRGEQTSGLAELGQILAQESRFQSCFVEHSFKLLMRRAPSADEQAQLQRFEDTFAAEGLRIRPLWEALALSDAFAEGTGVDGRRVVDPHLLSTMVSDLTGYRLEIDEWDLIRGPIKGYSALAGGGYGFFRFEPVPEPATTFLIVNKRLAEAAATHVVDADMRGEAPPRLLTVIDREDDPVGEPDVVKQQLVHLRKRILSQSVATDDPQILSDLAFMTRVFETTGSNRDAWIAMVSLLLRDPDFVVY